MTKKKRPVGGDFARGERTKATPEEGPDFARGERTKATPEEDRTSPEASARPRTDPRPPPKVAWGSRRVTLER